MMRRKETTHRLNVKRNQGKGMGLWFHSLYVYCLIIRSFPPDVAVSESRHRELSFTHSFIPSSSSCDQPFSSFLTLTGPESTPLNMEQSEPTNQPIDVSPNKDGGILKNIVREGHGFEKPSAGNEVCSRLNRMPVLMVHRHILSRLKSITLGD